MNKMRHTGFLLSLLTLVYLANGQTPPGEKEKTEFKISANYNTGLNYYGRVDSLRSGGFFPMAELWVNESFYLNAAPVFVNNSHSSFQYNGTVTSIGYQYNAENKWLGNIYLLKPFYRENSELVQAALKAQTGLTITRLNKIVNLTAGGDMKFSDKTDYGVVAGIDHIIRYQINARSVLVIDPGAYINAGTQQFTNTCLKGNTGSLLFPGAEEMVTESSQKFNVLSYEFMMPVVFATGNLQLLFTPAYLIPQNLLTLEGRPDLSEQGEKMFYVTFGTKMSF